MAAKTQASVPKKQQLAAQPERPFEPRYQYLGTYKITRQPGLIRSGIRRQEYGYYLPNGQRVVTGYGREQTYDPGTRSIREIAGSQPISVVPGAPRPW